jgi:[acyl-carrier-protein] S-malonyltransferase
MGADLAGTLAICGRTFEEAEEVLGLGLRRLCFEGPESALQMTAVAQPAILTTSIAVLRGLGEEGIEPDIVAGHSLGEYSALVAAGSLEFADAVALVHKRGTYMQDAVPAGRGAMAAILGLDRDVLAEVCREATSGDEAVSPANFNAPGQIVISGHTGAVRRAIDRARERGARRALELPVSAPFHCPLMEPAAARLAADLLATRFGDLKVPLVANVHARSIQSGEEARRLLLEQVTTPVLWEDCVRTLARMGTTSALEVGPGKVLTGLMKRIEPVIRCEPVGDTAGIAAAKENLA